MALTKSSIIFRIFYIGGYILQVKAYALSKIKMRTIYVFSALPPLLTQSITVPLQGFLNAIVYGWTRDDFLNIMAMTQNQAEEELDYSGVASEVEKLQEDSGIHASIREDEHPFTHTITITSDSMSDED